MNNITVEIREDVVRRGPIILVPYEEKYHHTGFTSMYGYPLLTGRLIESQNSTRQLSNCPVYSDVLYVDFDNNEEAAIAFKEKLKLSNYAYRMYDSGNRSVHFHIDIVPMTGVNVPPSQRKWMELQAPKADMSIYRHGGLYRLPNTVHSKTNRCKELLEVHEGVLLQIPIRPPVHVQVEESDPLINADKLGMLLHMAVIEGGRHKHAYRIARTAQLMGMNKVRAERLLRMWNYDKCYPRKHDWELTKIINWVYGE